MLSILQVSNQTSNVWSLLESNWKIEGLCPTTTSRKNPLFIWCWDFAVEFKYFWKHWLAKPLRWKLKLLTPLKKSKLSFKIKKVYENFDLKLKKLFSTYKINVWTKNKNFSKELKFITNSINLKLKESNNN